MRIGMLALHLAIATAIGTPAAWSATDEPMHAAISGYAHHAGRAYGDARRGAESLRAAITALLARPSDRTMSRARDAWIEGRDAYGRTEVFRFSGGPIDDVHPVTGRDGPEARINSWPIDEAFLDRVEGAATTGLIGDLGAPLTERQLIARNVADDETQVTLGYHVIEFLLWGQDLRRDGPGERPFSDYLPGDPARERRRRCLSLVTDQLVRDLRSVEVEWQPGPRRYAEFFRALSPGEALSRALSGAATLAAFELASERIGLPLSSCTQEDEQSCFSDNTHRDLAANFEGICMVLEGDQEAPGLLVAIDAVDETLGADLRARLQRVRALVYAVVPPFDTILSAPEEDPRRRTLVSLSGELIGLAGALQRAGAAAGARVVIGGGG